MIHKTSLIAAPLVPISFPPSTAVHVINRIHLKQFFKVLASISQGYDEVARQCEVLAVELLENCRSLGEVQLLLAEKSCAKRFFSQTKFLTYPRMRLAVEHGHKHFAGHIYCQQAGTIQWEIF